MAPSFAGTMMRLPSSTAAGRAAGAAAAASGGRRVAAAAAAAKTALRSSSGRRTCMRVEARGGGFGPMGGGGGGGGGGGQQDASWDPENLLGLPQTGHIARRMMQKQIAKDSEFAAAVSATKDDIRRQVLLRRSQRTPPDAPADLVEFFLTTDAEDMEFEVARCRPKLTPEFFRELDKMIGAARFGAAPRELVSASAAAAGAADKAAEDNEERLAELELLRQYLEEATEAVDKAVAATSTAAERVKKLLTAKDKKAMIMEMAEANEIDVPLMDLLQQNIEGAKAAGQADAAAFMEKVKAAAAKYLIAAAPAAGVAAVPAAPAALTGGGGGGGAGGGVSSGGIILPGSAGGSSSSSARGAVEQKQQPPTEAKTLIL